MSATFAMLCAKLRALGGALRTTAGVADYDRYVAHVVAHHPDREIPTRAAFFRERQAARYGRDGKAPCC